MAIVAFYATATIGSMSTTSTTMDCNHPYYLHPSDNPGMQIDYILIENNYNQWQKSMKITQSSTLKLGFVDGSYVKPAANSPDVLESLQQHDYVLDYEFCISKHT